MNKKWYKSNLVKALWLTVIHLVTAIAVVCGFLLVFVTGEMNLNPLSDSGKTYIQTSLFETDMFDSAHMILMNLSENAALVNIDIDSDTSSDLIDLGEVLDGNTLTGKNTSGLAYSVNTLKQWVKHSWDCAHNYNEGDSILVCEKPDGTYEYYYYKDFSQLINNRELFFSSASTSVYEDDNPLENHYLLLTDRETIDEYLTNLKYDGYSLASGSINEYDPLQIVDSDENLKYTNIWNYTGTFIKEDYLPEGASSILEVLNNTPEWNARIDKAYTSLSRALDMVSSALYEKQSMVSYQSENTNLTYLYVDIKNQKLLTNNSDYQNYLRYSNYLEDMKKDGSYIIIYPQLSQCETNVAAIDSKKNSILNSGSTLESWNDFVQNMTSDTDYVFAIKVDTDFPIADIFAQHQTYFNEYISSGKCNLLIAGIVCCVIIFLIGLVWLTMLAGRRPEDEMIHLCSFDHWFTEISALLIFFVWVSGLGIFFSTVLDYFEWSSYSRAALTGTVIISLYSVCLFLIGYLSLVRRIKSKTLWKDSFLRWLLTQIKKVAKAIRTLTDIYSRNTGSKIKITVLITVFFFIQFILNSLMRFCSPVFFILLAAVDIAALLYCIQRADRQEKILDGLKRISSGEIQYKIPLTKLSDDQKFMAEYINNIGSGLDTAIENSLKNERMKTELITNVSHDIKTPLTSIINYIDLLKREKFTDPKICEYLNILDEKAHRLKMLTEDVVEASKASTGNISLEMTELDFVEMLHQVIGEFEEKFQEKNLTMVVHFTDEPYIIYADGRRMWRVLENIFTNVGKYAMEGTRVYVDLNKADKQVIFTLKNISASPLNFSSDELTERFIRGDVSRSTEGSGLGLSIAKSLTELQGGEFKLYLDGDLFKVMIVFAERQ